MEPQNNVRDEARAYARGLLGKCRDFTTLAPKEQLALYKSLVDARTTEMSLQQGVFENGRSNGERLAGQMAPPLPRRTQQRSARASDKIDDSRHYNKRIEQAGDLAGDFVRNVDFPGFVRDLLKGVFDANLQVTLQQMKAYIDLMKAATQSVAKFVNAIDDTAAFGYLAENNSDEFSLTLDDDDKDEDGQPKPALADKEGNKLDLGDNEVKAKIMDAKIAMAKEQRALLRETILMGVSRLVVERGVVKASVLFDIKATEDMRKKDKAAIKSSDSTTASHTMGTGLIGRLLGGGDTGVTHARRHTEISLSSASSKATTSLEAKLAGSVEIVFKSDYFKLDNFATMYGPVRDQPAVPGAAGVPPALPGGGAK
jgi:hypothetical protein